MGSKKPKIPAPMIVYQSAPEPTPAPTPSADTNDPPANTNETTAPEVTPDEQRLQNILTRRRGRLGTIATSFKGALTNTASPARKTLLGE